MLVDFFLLGFVLTFTTADIPFESSSAQGSPPQSGDEDEIIRRPRQLNFGYPSYESQGIMPFQPLQSAQPPQSAQPAQLPDLTQLNGGGHLFIFNLQCEQPCCSEEPPPPPIPVRPPPRPTTPPPTEPPTPPPVQCHLVCSEPPVENQPCPPQKDIPSKVCPNQVIQPGVNPPLEYGGGVPVSPGIYPTISPAAYRIPMFGGSPRIESGSILPCPHIKLGSGSKTITGSGPKVDCPCCRAQPPSPPQYNPPCFPTEQPRCPYAGVASSQQQNVITGFQPPPNIVPQSYLWRALTSGQAIQQVAPSNLNAQNSSPPLKLSTGDQSVLDTGTVQTFVPVPEVVAVVPNQTHHESRAEPLVQQTGDVPTEPTVKKKEKRGKRSSTPKP